LSSETRDSLTAIKIVGPKPRALSDGVAITSKKFWSDFKSACAK